MKIYLFNPDTGAYLGEDFADETPHRGVFAPPPASTTIAPPQVGPDQIPVFKTVEQRWEVCGISCLTPVIPSLKQF
ncbi:hypothetical protein [Geobacter sp. AOG1]|uniref:hypothetical protein n=1 Tax=Geobacter sp. AOG1 TaxID=1566346 RepID=UPI001CC656B2|nr:hypothetical protein [Geobacter sp. AOG1]GFE58029.1 hypothetical protein AOG1_19090 [Geobacter sp. AOG1]